MMLVFLGYVHGSKEEVESSRSFINEQECVER